MSIFDGTMPDRLSFSPSDQQSAAEQNDVASVLRFCDIFATSANSRTAQSSDQDTNYGDRSPLHLACPTREPELPGGAERTIRRPHFESASDNDGETAVRSGEPPTAPVPLEGMRVRDGEPGTLSAGRNLTATLQTALSRIIPALPLEDVRNRLRSVIGQLAEADRDAVQQALAGETVPTQLLRRLLERERENGEFGSITRAIYGSAVHLLNQEIPAVLREFFLRSEGAPPAGCPISLPERDGAPMELSLFRTRIMRGELPWSLDLNPNNPPTQETLERFQRATRWYSDCLHEIARQDNSFNQELLSQTIARLNEPPPRGINLNRPEWLAGRDANPQAWFVAAAGMVDMTQRVRNTVTAIAALRTQAHHRNYPPGLPDPFGDQSPVRATITNGSITSLTIDLPQDLRPTPENLRRLAALQTWLDRYATPVQRDMQRLAAVAADQDRLLYWADLPQTGRLTANSEQGITLTEAGSANNQYNLVCPRFRVQEVDGRIRVHHTVEYYRSGPLSYMDIGAAHVGTRQLQHADYNPDDMVPIMRGGRLEMMPARNLAAWRSSQAFWYGAGRGVTMALDGLMLVTGSLALGTAARGISVAQRATHTAVRQALRESVRSSIRQGATSLTLSLTGVTGNGYWQNTEIGRTVNHARHLYFTADAFRGAYHAVRECGQGAGRWLGWLHAPAGGARSAAERASTRVEGLLRQQPWSTAETATRRAMHGAEWGLVGLLHFGPHHGTESHGDEGLLRLAQRQNLGTNADQFLQTALTDLTLPAGELRDRIQGLVARAGQAVRGDGGRERTAEQLASTMIDSPSEQERTMAAIGLLALARRETQPLAETIGGRSTNDVIEYLRQQAATSDQRSLRFIASQALFFNSRMGFPEFAEVCRGVIGDPSCSRELQVKATLGLGVAMWAAQIRERSPDTRDIDAARAAQSFNNTRLDLERTLSEQARTHTNQDVRAMSVAVLRALNRDDQQQAEHLLLTAGSLWQQHGRRAAGQFAAQYHNTLVTALNTNPDASASRDSPRGLQRTTAERYMAATALMALSADDQRRALGVSSNREAQHRIGHALVRCVNLSCPEIAPQALSRLLSSNAQDGALLSQLPAQIQNGVRTRTLSLLGQRTTDGNANMRAQLIGLLPDTVANTDLAQRAADSLCDCLLRRGHIAYPSAHPQVRQAAVEALGRLQLPSAVPTILGILGQQEGSSADPAAQVRLAAVRALRSLPERALAHHRINLPQLATALMETEYDPAVRTALQGLRDGAREQDRPTVHQIREARQQGEAELERPTGPNFEQPLQWLRQDPYFCDVIPENLRASLDNARRNLFRQRGGWEPVPVQPEQIERGYRQRITTLIRLAQDHRSVPERTASDAQSARMALAWLVNCHGVNTSQLPGVVVEAIGQAAQTLRDLCTIRRGSTITPTPFQAEMRPWICALAENPALPARIRLSMVDTLRDITRTAPDNGEFSRRAAGVCLRMFRQLHARGQRDLSHPTEHNRLFATVMHDLAFTYNIRAAEFIGPLAVNARSARLPQELRNTARECLDRTNDWTGILRREADQAATRSNYRNLAAAERATALNQALSRPGVHEQPRVNSSNPARPIVYTQACEDAVRAIYQSVAGNSPFSDSDPRLQLLDNTLNSANPRLRLAGAAALLRPDCPVQYRTRAVRALVELAEYGDRSDLGPSWRHTFRDEAREILADYSRTRPATSTVAGSTDEVERERAWMRHSRQTVSLLLDQVAPTHPMTLDQRVHLARHALRGETRETDRVGLLACACRGADLRSAQLRALRDQLTAGLTVNDLRTRLACALLLIRSGEAPTLAVQTLVNAANDRQDGALRQDAQRIVNAVLADTRSTMASVRQAVEQAGGQRRDVAALSSAENLRRETTADGTVLERRQLPEPDGRVLLIRATRRSSLDDRERTVQYSYDGDFLTNVHMPDGTSFERVGNTSYYRLRTSTGLTAERWTATDLSASGAMVFSCTTRSGSRTIDRTVSTEGNERRVTRDGSQTMTVEIRDGRVITIDTPGQTIHRREFLYENGRMTRMDVTRNCIEGGPIETRTVPVTFRLARQGRNDDRWVLLTRILVRHDNPGDHDHGSLLYPQITNNLTGTITVRPEGSYRWSGPHLVCDGSSTPDLRRLHPQYRPDWLSTYPPRFWNPRSFNDPVHDF